jgi:hypothetical protein
MPGSIERERQRGQALYIGNALTENRHARVVEAELGPATGTIEREAAEMVLRHSPG